MPSAAAIIVIIGPPRRAEAANIPDADLVAALDSAIAIGQHYEPLTPSFSTEALLHDLADIIPAGTAKQVAARNDALAGYPA